MTTWNDIEQEQKAVCKRLNLLWTPIDREMMVAINESLLLDIQPLNGLRHPKEKIIDGWYLWCGGEIPEAKDDFFKPIHAEHLLEKHFLVLKYLGLPSGYRFQIDDKGYEDVWFEQSLFDI